MCCQHLRKHFLLGIQLLRPGVKSLFRVRNQFRFNTFRIPPPPPPPPHTHSLILPADRRQRNRLQLLRHGLCYCASAGLCASAAVLKPCVRALTPAPRLQVVGPAGAVSKVICGDYFSCSLYTSGALYCWGSNAFGQLGDGTLIDRLAPVAVSNMGGGVTQVSAGSAHTCAIKLNSVWCWGSNTMAALGKGDCCGAPSNVPVQVNLGGPNTATAVAAGAAHSCALRTDGVALCWGR
jgi:alpha-tubulin suppressor-like RCC1 family protein